MLGVVKSKSMSNQRILKLKLTDVNLNLEKMTDSYDIVNQHHKKKALDSNYFKGWILSVIFFCIVMMKQFNCLYLYFWYLLISKH